MRAAAAVAPGQLDDIRGQGRFVVGRPRHLALGRAVLPEHPAGRPLGHAEPGHHMLDAAPTAGRAHQ
jgi:hypothetical protein